MLIIPDPTEEEPRLLTPASFAGVFAAVAVLVNLVVIIGTLGSHGWGPLKSALFCGPIVNFLLSVIGTVSLLCRQSPDFVIGGPMMLCWFLPAGAVITNMMIAFAMPATSGC